MRSLLLLVYALQTSYALEAEVFDDAPKHPPSIEMNLYELVDGPPKYMDSLRGLNKRELFQLKFQNTGDLVQVLASLHIQPRHFWAKKDRNFMIVRQRVRIQQPILESYHNLTNAVSNFGPFCELHDGQAVDPADDKVLSKQSAVGARWNSGVLAKRAPYHPGFGHEFSFPDFCSNLVDCPPSHKDCKERRSINKRCGYAKPCPSKGSLKNPNDECLKDASGKVVQGVLCPAGVSTPTGEPGCNVVLEGEPQFLSVHELVGTHQEDCGGRTCNSLADFRENCTNENHWQVFDPSGSIYIAKGTAQKHVCQVYQSHPACEENCFDPKCTSLSPGKREIGIPFWRGRCDVNENQARIEKLAEKFGFEGAGTKHMFVDPTLKGSDASCKNARQGLCKPKNLTGRAPRGPYCTRVFSQVCTPCHIPVKPLQKGLSMTKKMNKFSFCDYAVGFDGEPPACLDKKPSSGCCLYLGNCEGISDPAKASLDNDGFALVGARQNTNDMIVFLHRFAHEVLNHRVADNASFHEYAYRQWNKYPLMKNLDLVQQELFEANLLAGHFKNTASIPWAFIGLGGALLLLLLGFLTYYVTRKEAASRPPSAEQVLTAREEVELGSFQGGP